MSRRILLVELDAQWASIARIYVTGIPRMLYLPMIIWYYLFHLVSTSSTSRMINVTALFKRTVEKEDGLESWITYFHGYSLFDDLIRVSRYSMET